jgi:hypothetical protein
MLRYWDDSSFWPTRRTLVFTSIISLLISHFHISLVMPVNFKSGTDTVILSNTFLKFIFLTSIAHLISKISYLLPTEKHNEQKEWAIEVNDHFGNSVSTTGKIADFQGEIENYIKEIRGIQSHHEKMQREIPEIIGREFERREETSARLLEACEVVDFTVENTNLSSLRRPEFPDQSTEQKVNQFARDLAENAKKLRSDPRGLQERTDLQLEQFLDSTKARISDLERINIHLPEVLEEYTRVRFEHKRKDGIFSLARTRSEVGFMLFGFYIPCLLGSVAFLYALLTFSPALPSSLYDWVSALRVSWCK